jgi:uncharacterized protein YjbI with pentapeptide repeats
MSARNFLRWLREKGSAPLLAAIVGLSFLSAILIAAGKGVFSALAYLFMALLGIALVLGCLFAFPYAGIWKSDDGSTDEGATPPSGKERPREPDLDYVNELRTMLISTVVGAVGLVTILLTYESAKAAADSARATNQQAALAQKQQANERVTSAGNLMESKNPGVRTIGINTYRGVIHELIRDRSMTEAEAYSPLASYVKDRSPWTEDKEQRWASLKTQVGRKAEEDPRVGVGSLLKRAPDVQAALNVLGEQKQSTTYRADLRDVDLQGAAFGKAWLPRAIFSGAHLDYMDCRVGEAERRHADFQGADFQGASLYGAYFNKVNLTGAVFNTPAPGGKLRTSQITDLRDAHFRGAILTGTNFSDADLDDAFFNPTKDGAKTNLTNAKFIRASLLGARFDQANLTGADFTDAKLNGANFEGADLSNAILDGADLKGVRYDPTTEWPAGYYVEPGQRVIP